MGLWNLFFKSPNEKTLIELKQIVGQINEYKEIIEKLDDAQLKAQTLKFKEMLANGKTLNDILPEAFATVREASKRVLGLFHYDVQLMGGVVLHQGKIAEMRTGEGKTLVATLPTYLNALTGKGVHVITVNDYLSARDAVWMGKIHHFLGLSVACIQHEKSFIYEEAVQDDSAQLAVKVEHENLRPVTRKEAYLADVLYGTNNEFGFDYLRDNMVYRAEDMAQRPLHYTIIDEVDSILIDEARTPLIISSPDMESSELYKRFDMIAKSLRENEDYNIDEKMRRATLSEAGIHKVEKQLGISNMYAEGSLKMVFHIEQALSANVLYKKDVHYVVNNGEVVIVDEFTGRLMPGRRYSEGLHQAIEAKEHVEIKQESKTLATITFQNLFRLYEKLSGMTGTAATEAEEFSKIYSLDVVVIPTNKENRRSDKPDNIYRTEKGKYQALVREIKESYEKGQPVLVGTISIEKNELLSAYLNQAGIPHELLNAKNHEREAQIIAQAGRLKAVTVATNMAGRGVDIVLGGNPVSSEEAQKVKDLGGLKVLGSERHESRRIDNQLRGRAGRQGDPGETQFFLSMDDDLMRIFGSDRIKSLMSKLGIPEDMPINNKIISKSIESAQTKVEGHHFDIRKHLVEYDDVINKHREVIYALRRRLMSMPDSEARAEVLSRVDEVINNIVSVHCNPEQESAWNMQEIYESMQSLFPLNEEAKDKILNWQKQIDGKHLAFENRTALIEYLNFLALAFYETNEKNIEAAIGGLDPLRQVEKHLILQSIDHLWIEHLSAMDYLRTGIGLRGYGQLDPLVEYKREGYMLFTQLLNQINLKISYNAFRIRMAPAQAESAVKNVAQANPYRQQLENRQQGDQQASAAAHAEKQKVGRNDECPCGSGLKYKRCCGK
ncbi:MAG TPA: preprotein translocase subunit SecA [bacterium]|nr:preprotein translocase subunit SecA [bacterium]